MRSVLVFLLLAIGCQPGTAIVVGVPSAAGLMDDAGLPDDAGPADAGSAREVPPSTQPPVDSAQGPTVVVFPPGSPQSDGGTAGVFTSLQAAIGAVSDGGTVLVNDGTYPGPVAIGPTRARVNVTAVGAAAVVDCSTRINGWQQVTGAVYAATPLAPVAAVFVDGGFLQRARYPASGYATVAADDPAISGFSSIPLTASDDALLSARPLTSALATLHVIDYWWNTSAVLGIDGGVLQLGAPPNALAQECSRVTCDLNYPALKDWGFYLENEPWMLTQPGGWVYDATANRLSVWLPDSSDPNVTPVFAAGFADCVVVSQAPDVALVGLHITRSGRDGLSVAASPGARFNRLTIRDVKRLGLYVRSSDPFIVDDSIISHTGSDCVRHSVSGNSSASLTTAFESNVLDWCGMALSPTFTAAAFTTYPSRVTSMTVRRNLFRHTAYVGVIPAAGTRFEGNTLIDTCLTSDDCGAIYTSGSSSSQVIRDNMVVGVTANTQGKGRGPYPAAGIYLDDFAHDVVVENNRVLGADIGLFLHNAHDNVVQDNQVLESHQAGIRLQEDSVRKAYNLSLGRWEVVLDGGSTFPSMSANQFVDNRLVDAVGTVGVRHDSNQRSTVAGLIDAYQGRGNEYWAFFSRVNVRSTSGQWEFGDLGPLGLDVAPWRPSTTVVDAYTVSATQSPTFALSVANQTAFGTYAASGTVTSAAVACPSPSASGACVRLQASTTAPTSLLISPSFSIVAGQLYRMTVEVSADQAQPVEVRAVLRRAGPTYESLNALPDQLSLKAPAGRWTSVNFFAVASATVSPARLDLEVPQGAAILLGDLTVTPVTGVPVSTSDHLFVEVNASFVAPLDSACSSVGCSGWREADGGLASWPVTLPPRGTRVLWR